MILKLTINTVLMNSLDIYDVNSTLSPNSADSSNGWWTQTVDGEVPSPRVDFCAVVVSAPDKSSFNIHLYGGKGTFHITCLSSFLKELLFSD